MLNVEPGSPAAAAGIREEDVVIAVEGEPVGSSEELVVAVDAHDPGDTVTVEVVRGGSSQRSRPRSPRPDSPDADLAGSDAWSRATRPRRTGAAVFDSIGWGEIVVLALAALFIFGPERLPGLAKDAAAGLKKVRAAITGVREQVNESLGDDLAELRDLDLRKYHPKTFIRSQLLGDDDARRSAGGAPPRPPRAVARPRDHATPPPFDPPTRPDRPPADTAAIDAVPRCE